MKKRNAFAVGLATTLCLTFSPLQSAAQTLQQQKPNKQAAVSARDRRAVEAFEKRVKEYSKLRESIEAGMPKLSKESTPEQIQAHKTAFEEKVRAARAGAKPGQVFTEDIALHIRALIRNEFKGTDRKHLRATVQEADTKGVPLRVNYPYPESKELLEMPPTLLLKLPLLPKQVRYRFVGRHMLLVDRENGLIIDYMFDAVP
jgi:CHASE1-domain containing sensor protein